MPYYRAKYECAFCNAVVMARFDYCSTCDRVMKASYGKNWIEQEWARFLIENQRYLARLEEQNHAILDAGTRYERSAVLSIHDPSISEYLTERYKRDRLDNPYTVPHKSRDTHYDVTIRQLIKQGYGARVIHHRLKLAHNDKTLSLSTIQRRIREYHPS